MSTISIGSSGEWDKLLASTSVVIADFYADWCGPCKMIAPHYESLAKKHSSPKKVAFAKVNTDTQSSIAQSNGISAMPTFKIFHNGACVDTIKGANPSALTEAVDKAVKLAGRGAAPSGAAFQTPGRTLGQDPASAGPRRAGGVFSTGNLLNVLMAAVGLYLASLFSFDPYKAAENSRFNIHNKDDGKPGARLGGFHPNRGGPVQKTPFNACAGGSCG